MWNANLERQIGKKSWETKLELERYVEQRISLSSPNWKANLESDFEKLIWEPKLAS
jgi:hypothetical protein